MHEGTLGPRSVLVGTAKSGHLDIFATEHDVRESETPADQNHPAKQLLHLLRPCVSDDVKVLGPQIQQQVAHAAAHHASAIATPVQAAKHLQDIGRKLPRLNARLARIDFQRRCFDRGRDSN